MSNDVIAITDEEKNKAISKGRSWLRNYLNDVAKNSDLSDEQKKKLFGIITNAYRKYMKEDDLFFAKNYAFISARRTADEKVEFFRRVTTGIVEVGHVRDTYFDIGKQK